MIPPSRASPDAEAAAHPGASLRCVHLRTAHCSDESYQSSSVLAAAAATTIVVRSTPVLPLRGSNAYTVMS